MMTDLRDEFATLQQETIEAYEMELAEERERHESLAEELAGQTEQRMAVLEEGGVDLQQVQALDNEFSAIATERFQARNTELVQREPLNAPETEDRYDVETIACEAESTLVGPYSSLILAYNERFVEGIEGERGNPWVRPYSRDRLELYTSAFGHGWGCQSSWDAPTDGYIFYRFTPNKSGLWHLMPRAGFHGFYQVQADDAWYSCKYARSSVRGRTDVKQYQIWRETKNWNIIDQGGDNINVHKGYDHGVGFPFDTYLRGGDLCWVRLRIRLNAWARGNGSHSTANFKSGRANYIAPWYLVATHLH